MASQPDQERVLVVPTALFRQVGYFQGFNSEVSRYISHLFNASEMSFRPRAEVEPNPEFKQLIPYVIICYEKEGTWHLFSYTRGSGQGEARLHRKRSIGIGGHISANDAEDRDDLIMRGVMRELNEEVIIDTPYKMECVGLINDDTTNVGSVHLGIVYRCIVSRPAVRPREKDIVSHGFSPVGDLMKYWNEMETWSQIALKGFFGMEAPAVD
ncbi:MAG: phosphoesterase [Thermogutta sp.]